MGLLPASRCDPTVLPKKLTTLIILLESVRILEPVLMLWKTESSVTLSVIESGFPGYIVAVLNYLFRLFIVAWWLDSLYRHANNKEHIAHLRQQRHNSKFVIFHEKRLKVLKWYNLAWVQRRHNCSPAASFANCVMTLYLLKVHMQTFLFYTNNSKMPNFELWHSCSKWAPCLKALQSSLCFITFRITSNSVRT